MTEELDKLGIRENTLITFTSDNGPDPIPSERDNQGLRGTKYTVYEGGLHVPFILNWKGSLEPSHEDNVIHFTDVFPSLIEICNLQLIKSIDFQGGMAEVLKVDIEKKLLEKRHWLWRGAFKFIHPCN